MDISPYFAKMIKTHDQVVVPGLGKFYKKRSEGFYDEETKTFYPPSTIIDFSAEYIHDDKLVQLISQDSGSSLTSAYAALDEYVRDLKSILKSSPVVLPELGKLSLLDDKIQLATVTEPTLNQAYFGLPSINLDSSSFKGDDDTKYSLAQQALNTAVEDDEEEYTGKSNTVKIVLMVVFIGVLGALIALYYTKPEVYQNLANYFRKNKTTVPATPNTSGIDPKAVAKADSIYDTKDPDSIEAKLKAQGFEVEKVKDSTDVSVKANQLAKPDGFRHEIIIYFCKSEKEAKDKVKFFNNNGIPAHIVSDAGGVLIKISGATLYNQKEADQELERIQNEINPQAYDLKIKILNNKK